MIATSDPRNFERLEVDVDVSPILDELRRQPEAWHEQTGRRRIAVQAQADVIPIRGLRKSKIAGRRRRDVHESRFTTLSRRFPATVGFLRDFAEAMDGRLGRARIVRLAPGRRVLPHVDSGAYYACRDRYHLVLVSAGSWMRCGDEEVVMRAGELWWFDNKQEHEAANAAVHRKAANAAVNRQAANATVNRQAANATVNRQAANATVQGQAGGADRIHLIFDLEPRCGRVRTPGAAVSGLAGRTPPGPAGTPPW